MILYSTNDPQKRRVSFSEALINAFPADKGLYVPALLPRLTAGVLESLPKMDFPNVAQCVAQELLSDEYTGDELEAICYQAFNFPIELRKLSGQDYVLELFHGPTLAFKDFGARFMALCLEAALRKSPTARSKRTVVLTATSGDTGGAVASGFKGIPNVDVVILYPAGRVSAFQRRQLTTPGENVFALAVNCSFDDCQRLVKEAFLDPFLRAKFQLCSANSINIGRLIPQSFYYFYAWSRMHSMQSSAGVSFGVPSGNFGNLTAGVIAWKMGLPVKHFIAACNENDSIPRFLLSGVFEPRQSLETMSSAMDVGNPSNFPRLMYLFGNDPAAVQRQITGYRVSDQETLETMEDMLTSQRYMLDPHTAVGVKALSKYRMDQDVEEVARGPAVILSTAHASKFWSETLVGTEGYKLPSQLEGLRVLPERMINIEATLAALQDFLKSKLKV